MTFSKTRVLGRDEVGDDVARDESIGPKSPVRSASNASVAANAARTRSKRAAGNADSQGSLAPPSAIEGDGPDREASVLGDPLDNIVIEREAGRGDSEHVVVALATLMDPRDEPFELARVECLIETGFLESPLRLHHWADTIEGLSADKKGGYEKLLQRFANGLTLSAQMARIRAVIDLSPEILNAIAVVRAFRAASRGNSEEAVAALAALIKLHGGGERSIEAVEGWLSREPRLPKPESLDASEKPAFVVPMEHRAAYRAAISLLAGGDKSKKKQSEERWKLGDKTAPATRSEPSADLDRGVASTETEGQSGGDGSDEGWGPYYEVGKDAINEIPDPLLNPRLGAILLVQHGVPPELAWWIATFKGVKVMTDEERYAEFEADRSASFGSRTPIDRTESRAREGGYKNFAIRDGDQSVATAESIKKVMEDAGVYRIRLSLGYYETHVAPLLAMNWQEWIKANNVAVSYRTRLEELEAKDEEHFKRTGRHDPSLMRQIIEAKGLVFQYETHADDLKTGKTNVTAESGAFAQRVAMLEGLIEKAEAEAARLQKQLKDYEEAMASAREITSGAGERGAIGSPVHVWNLQRGIAEAGEYAGGLRQELADLNGEQDLSGRFPTELAFRRDKARKAYYGTPNGEFAAPDVLSGIVRSADAGAATVSSDLYSGMAFGTKAIGTVGAVADPVYWFTGESWFKTTGDAVSQKLYTQAATIDNYASGSRVQAERHLGKMGALITESIVSGALYMAILAPAGLAGNAIKAAAGGSRLIGTGSSMALLATAGVAMNSDKSGTEMIKSGALMAIAPLIGGSDKSVLVKVLSAFLGGAAIDGAGQVDIDAAVRNYRLTGSLSDAANAAIAPVDVRSMLVSGLLDAMLAVTSQGKRGNRDVVNVEGSYYRLRNGDWESISAKKANRLSSEIPKLNAQEFSSIRDASGSGAQKGAADDLITAAESREVARSVAGEQSTVLDARIKKLEKQGGDARTIEQLKTERDLLSARARVLEAAQSGAPIPIADIEAANMVPVGYEIDGGSYRAKPDLASAQLKDASLSNSQSLRIAKDFGRTLDTIRNLDTALRTEMAKAKPNQSLLRTYRKQLADAGSEARALREIFEAAIDASRTDPVNAGASSTSDPVAAVPERYGGVAAEVVPGDTALGSAQSASTSQLGHFDRLAKNAMADGVILNRLELDNVTLRADGTVAIVDSTVVTKKQFTQNAVKLFGDEATPARVASDWARAQSQFKAKVDKVMEGIAQRIGGDAKISGDRLEIVGDEARPPLFRELMLEDVATRTEAMANNVNEGTCSTAAMKNVISTMIRGREAYVIEFSGTRQSELVKFLTRSGFDKTPLGKQIAAGEQGAHAVAAIRDGSGWRYISWGKVYTSWRKMLEGVYGDTAKLRGLYETGDHVIWMTRQGWEYPTPTKKTEGSGNDGPADGHAEVQIGYMAESR